MSISTSQLKVHSISAYQYICITYIFTKYLDTTTIRENSTFHKTKSTHDMIFTKSDDSTSDKQVELLS